MTDPSALRVSDAERDRAAADLREHFAAGRLSSEELDERLDAIYRARTQAELRALHADLPPLPVTRAQHGAEVAERRADLWRQVLQQTGGATVPFLICTAIWAANGAHGGFWPAWVALVAIIPLLRNGWRLYGPSPELERVEADLARRRRHDGRRAHRHRLPR